ncbi:catalase family protein [Bradyrhizobium sp. UFLA05-109]
MAADQYVRYDPSVEQPSPEEADAVRDIVASIERTSDATFKRFHHGIRQQHAKGVGFLRGELTVYDNLPAHLRQGLFAKPARHPIIVRLSTAFGLKSDRVRAPRGMAIKVLGVSGDKALADDTSTNQDFLLVNHPSYMADAKAYLAAQRNVERNLNTPDVGFRIVGFFSRIAITVSNATGAPIPLLAKALGDPGNNILGETFHTEGTLRFGDYIARIRAVPVSDAVRRLTGQPSHDGDEIVRDSVTEFFRENFAEYELRAQLCTDLKRTPVEDSSIDWPEDVAVPQPLGKITLPLQAANTSTRRDYANDVLSFDPWRCLADHQPLGSIMRLRRDAYRASRERRHKQNGPIPPPREPQDISEFPD